MKILIDGVFFQHANTGIARVWKSLLEAWVNDGFSEYLLVLDRAGTAPIIPGVHYRQIPPYDYGNIERDREHLQQICDEEAADLFVSTYYTTPLTTPSVLLVHDMIPEAMGADLTYADWREKHHCITAASAYITVSQNTAKDLLNFFPQITPELVTVAYNGISPEFSPASTAHIDQFKATYGITKPYFLISGLNTTYKNNQLFFQAFAQLCTHTGFEVICPGSQTLFKPEWRTYTSGSTVQILQLTDAELIAAYSGAIALVYPSKYEGFGLPILEAMACGCPVITCPNASIPEVAGEAALYVQDDDIFGMANALCDVQKPGVRQELIARGLPRSQQFSWATMAEIMRSVLVKTTLQAFNLRKINWIAFPNWQQSEEILLAELVELIQMVMTHHESQNLTLLIYANSAMNELDTLSLSDITMSALMQTDLAEDQVPEIALVNELSPMQWQVLASKIQQRVGLASEDEGAIAETGMASKPILQLSTET
ncbi:glycosyltransferase family 4 protein [Pantanalinema rosaneae CENA516]|uniref:glycosyltransferase family 4 protein n=1 Tax=Pantanalinema rosaneae TaxID=1620701 RepID=UPI003D6F8BA5